MTPIERLLATAQAEEGYLEKASNSQLDSPTANAGKNNWTKYACDLDAQGRVYNGKKNGYAWCDIFMDWCFITTFGLDLGMKLLCQAYSGYGAGYTWSMRYFKQKGQFHKSDPQPGYQVFFTRDGGETSYHTGLVVKVNESRVYTIEGNTSSAARVVANGGCVRSKFYALPYAQIAGYGRPDFGLVPSDERVREETTGVAPWAEAAWGKACVKIGRDGKPVLDGTRPADAITRQEMAVVLDRLGLLDM